MTKSSLSPRPMVDRRAVLAGGTAALASRAIAAGASPGAVNVVERFGFVPDGKTDNYVAFRRLAEAATRAGGGRFFFPRGTYFVRTYRTSEVYQRPAFRAQRPSEVTNAQYRGCNGLELIGDRAQILLNGRFHRGARLRPDGIAEGVYAAIFMPFELLECRNVRIEGFTIDGGVREMTRDSSLTETYAYLIALHGCRGVMLRDLTLRHSQADAILLSDGMELGLPRGLACRDVTLERVSCANSARGALAAIQILGLRATDCSFDGSAFGTGAYGHHAPGFGVDVEPDRFEPSEVDTRTGNLHFERCTFRDNYSAFLAAYTRKYQGYLRLIDCLSSNANDAPNHIIIAWPGAIVQGGRHDCGAGTFWSGWHATRDADLTIRDTVVTGSGHYGIFHAFEDNVVRMERVTLTATHRGPTFGTFPSIEGDPGQGRRNLVRDCKFLYPRARKSPGRDAEPIASFNHTDCAGNAFRTDLPAADGSFLVMYGPQCAVSGDRFAGTRPGPGDTIRPSPAPLHDSRTPYSRS